MTLSLPKQEYLGQAGREGNVCVHERDREKEKKNRKIPEMLDREGPHFMRRIQNYSQMLTKENSFQTKLI